MKKLILIISFCCLGFIVQAQKFLTQNIAFSSYGDSYKNIYNTRIMDYRLIEDSTLYRLGMKNDPKKLPEFSKQREKWLKKIEKKVLTKELKHCLKDTSVFGNKRFWIDVYFEKDGTVFTILFEIEQHLYKILPEKWVKETFNSLMKERIKTTDFWNFASSKEPETLGIISISVRDLLFKKIRDQDVREKYPIIDPQ